MHCVLKAYTEFRLFFFLQVFSWLVLLVQERLCLPELWQGRQMCLFTMPQGQSLMRCLWVLEQVASGTCSVSMKCYEDGTVLLYSRLYKLLLYKLTFSVPLVKQRHCCFFSFFLQKRQKLMLLVSSSLMSWTVWVVSG